jgi:ribonucleoside-diphosphate reductase subunit M1
MPTASTAQIRRNCESVEAHQNNLYSRKVLKCSYPVLNRYLLADLSELGLWNDKMVEYLTIKNGSVNGLVTYIHNNNSAFPNFTGNYDRLSHIERKYKTMWEISQKTLLKLAAERARYIDQSSSTNIFIKDCTDEKLQACHLYSNMLGLKTLMYYLRQTGGETIKFTVDSEMVSEIHGIKVDLLDPPNNDEEEIDDDCLLDGGTGNGPLFSSADKPRPKIECTDEICKSCT